MTMFLPSPSPSFRSDDVLSDSTISNSADPDIRVSLRIIYARSAELDLGERQKRAYRHFCGGGKPVPLDSRLRGNDVALIVGEFQSATRLSNNGPDRRLELSAFSRMPFH